METIALPESFGTLSETINGLKELGYDHDFNVQDECLICHQTNTSLQPKDFQIDHVYRFEGASNPDDQSILYAISSLTRQMKGVLVNGYGISSDEKTATLIEQLQTHPNNSSMTNKSNEATPLRPEGDRPLNAALVEMNLNQFIDQIKSETTWAESDRNSITLFKSHSMRIVLMGLHEQAELKTHKANGIISVQVIEGKINFNTEQQEVTMEKGQMIALQENILHSVKAKTDSFFLLTLAMSNK